MVLEENLPNDVKEQYEKISDILRNCEKTLESVMELCVVVKEKLMDIRNMFGNVEQKLRELPNGIKQGEVYLYSINKVKFLDDFRRSISEIDKYLSKMFDYIDNVQDIAHHYLIKCSDKFFEVHARLEEIYRGISTTKQKFETILSVIKDLVKKNNHKPVKIEDVLREAEKKGIAKEDAEKLLNILIKNGEIYTPKPGYVMYVSL